MPDSFTRPSISVTGDAPRRRWRNVLACDLVKGDTVPGIGRIDFVDQKTNTNAFLPDPTATTWTVTVIGGSGNMRVYPGYELVFAFTAAE
jgi:hypothetical protein